MLPQHLVRSQDSSAFHRCNLIRYMTAPSSLLHREHCRASTRTCCKGGACGASTVLVGDPPSPQIPSIPTLNYVWQDVPCPAEKWDVHVLAG